MDVLSWARERVDYIILITIMTPPGFMQKGMMLGDGW